MDVILLERIPKLGQMGDVVSVKNGYARNFLLPQQKALRATEDNKKAFESRRATLEANNLERKQEADQVAEKLGGETFVAIRQAGDTGQLYGSVTSRDIAELATESGFQIDRRQVELEGPIKALGLHPVKVTLHPEVIVDVTLNVARSDEEAERQARGEDVTMLREDGPEFDTFDPDAMDDDLLDDGGETRDDGTPVIDGSEDQPNA
ncbi:MAG: 50S ribosomal protein L9 [Pseudomonadota bacterium]